MTIHSLSSIKKRTCRVSLFLEKAGYKPLDNLRIMVILCISSITHFLTKAGSKIKGKWNGEAFLKFLSKLLKVAANEKRLLILKTLMFDGAKAMEIGEIALKIHVPYKTAARNLKILERFDFLDSNFHKGMVYYTLKNSKKFFYNQVIMSMIEKYSKEDGS
jgi:DNA-binding transcriptional ArsR family regulator